jgi:hypothetical protein
MRKTKKWVKRHTKKRILKFRLRKISGGVDKEVDKDHLEAMKILQEYVVNFKPYVVAADNTHNGYDKYDDIGLLAWNIILYGNKSDDDLILIERIGFKLYVIFQYFQKLADIIFHFHRNENHNYTQNDITDIAKIITGHKKALTDVSAKFETDQLDTDRLATTLILKKTKKLPIASVFLGSVATIYVTL